jgi:hypothetical protein
MSANETRSVSALLFLRARPARSVLLLAVLLGGLTAWLGMREAPVPTAAPEASGVIPIWRLLAMAAAVLPVIALHSRLADLEVVATRRLRSAQRAYLAGMTGICAAVFLSISSIMIPPHILAIMGRSWLAWAGLALLAGVLFGWRLSWTLPAGTATVLIYWGYGGDGYRWWEFSARPYDDLPSLLLSFALFAVGLFAYAATPWRRRHLMHR